MTYHTIRLKIKTGSVDEKREAINQLFHRNSQTASRLLIEAAKDESDRVVSLAVLGMRSGPEDIQYRYRQSYSDLAEHQNGRIREIAIANLKRLDDERNAEEDDDSGEGDFEELDEWPPLTVDESRRVEAYDKAIAELSTNSPDLARHFKRLLGPAKQAERAVRHLRASGSQIVEVLVIASHHPNSRIQLSAMDLLAELKDPRAFDAAFPMLGESEIGAKVFAIIALGKLGDPRALNPLIEIACGAQGPFEQFGLDYIALQAVNILEVDRKQALLKIYSNSTKKVSSEAVRMLTDLKDESIVSFFEQVLRGDNDLAAFYGLQGIARIGTEYCREIVKRHLHDDRPKIRSVAEQWIRKWNVESEC